ncbi:glycosyltransferase family 39 protein [Candidatus Saccharibacteria bacterium]|nr:glycosyltransferase family 39 protein [Candidatus Saccharibacteria bacterium]
MKKRVEQFFLYRHRFVSGYILLAVFFFALLSFLPTIAPGGLSQAEMDSAVQASQISPNLIEQGNIVDLPYTLLQKASHSAFGLNLLSIKLPSIIIAVATAFFIILLLNRWFKSDVAIIASILTTLSTAFLFLATSGTPAIMYVFWLAIILWSGSKIVGNEHVNPLLVMLFFASIALSLYTPQLVLVALVIAIAGLTHPHLRFTLKQLKKYQLFISIIIFALIVTPLVAGIIKQPENIQSLCFMKDFSFGKFIQNISSAFAPFFSFSLVYNSVYLAPLFGLATVALVVIGVLASVGKMFMSRNTVVSLLVIFSIIISSLNPAIAISIIIPVAILSAAGVESIIEKWYSLFPENPYAHLFGIIPIVIVMGMIIISGLTHFIFGYHYAPRVAENFNNDLTIIQENVDKKAKLIIAPEDDNYHFYKLLAKYEGYKVKDSYSATKDKEIATFGSIHDDKYRLKQIITSPKSRKSDRLYIYSLVTEK